jgi:hypothetical protein
MAYAHSRLNAPASSFKSAQRTANHIWQTRPAHDASGLSKCGSSTCAWIVEHRDQLWAEAVHREASQAKESLA